MTDVTSPHRVGLPREELALLMSTNTAGIVPLQGRTVTIGRDRSNDIVLADRTVSSLHCQVAEEAGLYRVKDLGSRNGTLLNGVSVREGTLHSGTRLEVGREVLLCIRRPTTKTIGAGREKLVGSSPIMTELRAELARFALRDAPVLLHGESGTGKELAARDIHRLSARAHGAFVSVNCGALPQELAMSELFGHERGAFTGASAHHRGAFEQAQGGTLFLDEIGELDGRLQAALLRVLETGELRRVGSEKLQRLDVRFIAATNRDLLTAIRDRDFRRDLYHRLAVLVVAMPPLREHPSDIAEICSVLLERAGARCDIDLEAMELLSSHRWPGNVRELRNVLERACALSQGRRIFSSDLRFDIHRREALRVEELSLLQMLEHHNGNVSALARTLGMSRSTLRDWVRKIKSRR